MKKSFNKFLSAAVVLGLVTACEFEDYNLSDLDTDNISLSTGLSAPIGRSSITIKDLLDREEIEGVNYDSTGMIVFQYDTIQHYEIEGLEFSGFEHDQKISAFDLLSPQLKEQGIESWEDFSALDMAIEIPVEKATEMTFEADVDLNEMMSDFEDQRIDSIIFKKAPVRIQLSTNIKGLLDKSDMTIGLLENGHVTNPEKAKAADPFTFDLSKNIVRLNNEGMIKFGGSLIVKEDKKLKIDKHSCLIVSLYAEDGSLLFSKVWGVFSNIDPVTGSEIIDIDIYEKNENDGMEYNLQLVDPKLTMKINSNIGIPFSMDIEKLEASNADDSIKAKFNNGKNSYATDLKYAKKVGDEVAALDETFNAENGTIDKLLNILPNKLAIDYKFEAVEKPKDSKENFFLTDDAYFDLTIGVDMPAYLRKGSFITVTDTIKDIDFLEDLDVKYTFDKIKVKAAIENRMPFDADVKVVFLQEDTINGDIVISAIPNKDIEKSISVKSGEVGKDDNVTKPTKNNLVINFDKKDVPSLKKAKHILLEYNVKVSDAEKVKVSRDNSLKVDLKAYVKGDAYINEF